MEFPKISKKEWKAKIKQELRGKKSLEELRYHIEEYLNVDVLLQEEDRVNNDPLTSFPANIAFGISCTENVDNSQILECLSSGGSCIYLPSIAIKGNLFKEVRLDLIDLFVNDKKDIALTFPQKREKSIMPHIHAISHRTLINIALSLSRGTFINDLSAAIKEAEKATICLELNDSFLLSIATLRAVRIFLQRKKRITKIATISNCKKEERDEYNLIRLTSQTMAAMAGGSDYHFYPCHSKTPNIMIRRMMHVSNVINMESSTKNIKDPWRGSYMIEHMTSTIVNAIEKRWSQR